MCLVGYVDMPNNQELGFGRFILRNSWGANWGINSPYGAGYGTIPYAYLAKLGTEAHSIS
jgi:C1A family cysteine protease